MAMLEDLGGWWFVVGSATTCLLFGLQRHGNPNYCESWDVWLLKRLAVHLWALHRSLAVFPRTFLWGLAVTNGYTDKWEVRHTRLPSKISCWWWWLTDMAMVTSSSGSFRKCHHCHRCCRPCLQTPAGRPSKVSCPSGTERGTVGRMRMGHRKLYRRCADEHQRGS